MAKLIQLELPKIITLLLFSLKYDILFCLVVILQNNLLISCVLSNIALKLLRKRMYGITGIRHLSHPSPLILLGYWVTDGQGSSPMYPHLGGLVFHSSYLIISQLEELCT